MVGSGGAQVVDFQSGEFPIALITRVTHACPRAVDSGGCSESYQPGSTQDTAGRFPSAAALKNRGWYCTLFTWWFFLTSVKSGSGFHGSGVPIGRKWSTPGVQWTISSVVPSQSWTDPGAT